MKTHVGKRFLSFLLALVMVLGTVPALATPKPEAAALPDYASLKSTIQGLKYPMASTTNWPAGGTSTMDGIYLIVTTWGRNGGTGANYFVMDPARPEAPADNKSYVGYAVQPTEKLNELDIIGLTRDSYSFIRGTATSFSIQRIDRSGYWKFGAIDGQATYGSLRISGGDTHNRFYIGADSSGRFHYILDREHNWYLHSNSWTFRASIVKEPQTGTVNPHHQNLFWLCKVNEEAFYLRDALHDAMAYLIDNSTGRYPTEAYEAFLRKTEEATNYYNSITKTRYHDISTAEAKRHKEELYVAMGKLKLNDTTLQYIDIPIEVLDFRGDGFLFESKSTWTSPYSLSCDPADKSHERFPGKYTKVQAGGDVQDNFYIDGLVASELVGGKVIYTQKTVDYIAYHLSQKTDLKAPVDKMNRAFHERITNGGLTYNATNGYADTLTRCEPAEVGGVMHWNQIKTYHDLAYFMLSHIWSRSTDIIGTDTLANGTSNSYTYNVPVSELTNLRLFKSGEDYSFSSANASIGYDNDHIYNDGTYRQRNDPWFRPASDMGFENPSLYGKNTEGNSYMPEVNYGFSLHAHGGFVYTEDSDLHFKFGGDDDVYFFINNKLVCDIGGIHGHIAKEVYLNDLVRNGTLSLKEGQICRFDMFYVDRHTTGINLNFSTNIRIMDESVITEKTQYDPVTGLELPDGAALNTGADVGYTFSLTNRCSGPVKKLQFVDPKLNVSLDGGTKRASLNGQQASELTLTYRSYNAKTAEVYAGEPMDELSYSEFFTLIQAAVDNVQISTPLESCAYAYSPRNETELLDLLALGIPANCKLSIRGFTHSLSAGEFINSLSTTCTPLKYDPVENTITEQAPVSGAASCRSVGMDLTGVAAIPYRVVPDYGKPVEIDLRKVDKFITGDSGISFQYVGSTFDGRHGLVRAKEPLNLIFKAGGESYDRELGTFRMNDANILRYSPKGLIEKVDSFCAVYKVTIASQPNFVAYLFNAVEFLPAHTVYYEAEKLADMISITKKVTDKDSGAVNIQNTWQEENLKAEGTPGGAVQDHVAPGEAVYIPDYRNHPEVLFFGFDNTAEDRERYSTVSSYGNRGNYDDPANCDTLWYVYKERPTKVQSNRIDNTSGAMVITARAQAEGPISGDIWPDIFLDTIYGGKITQNYNQGYVNHPLNYNPKNAQVYQVRFKMKNFRIGTVGNAADSQKSYPYIRMEYSTVTSGNPVCTKITDVTLRPDLLTADEYVVMTLELPDAFRTCGTVRKIRAYWGGLESISASQLGELTVDYIYVGPRNLAPVEATYGLDTSYRTDAKLSNGESLFVYGNGVRLPSQTPESVANYTEINFTFTGTGFDLISRTDEAQGAYRVAIYKKADPTKAIRTLSVNNKGEMSLYQVPTVSVRDLEHGTYTVSIMVNDKITNAPYEFMNRGNEFYLDAIRIYNPIDVSAGPNATEEDAIAAYEAYCMDGEAYPTIRTVRDFLLNPKDLQEEDSFALGAIYVDTVNGSGSGNSSTGDQGSSQPNFGVNNHITDLISTYDKIGPKNEVYLGPGQMIAFRLVIRSQELPKHIGIGCKSIEGGSTVLRVVAAKDASNVYQKMTVPIESGTAQYYTLSTWKERFATDTDKDGNPIHCIYIIIENVAASGVLSITDIKVSYSQKPTVPTMVQPAAYSPASAKRNTAELPTDYFIDFVVDSHMADVLMSYLNSAEEAPCMHYPGPWTTEAPSAPEQEGKQYAYCIYCGEFLFSGVNDSASELSFAATSVSLYSNLAINYKVHASLFAEGGYEDPFVVVTADGTERVIRNYEITDGGYTFVYRNIAPHQIGDTVTATLYAYRDGVLYSSEEKEYSVADYCYNVLAKTEGNDTYAPLRRLLVNILHYGAKTQEYMSYKLEELCNSCLTPAQLACGTELTREPICHRDLSYKVVEDPTVAWKGAGLNLRESVAIRFKLDSVSYEDLELRVTLGESSYTYYARDLDHRADGTYLHFTQLNATQMSEPVYVAAFRHGVQVSNTICYSVESYTYSMQNNTTVPYLGELVKCMLSYGDAAKAYIHSAE